MRKFTISSFPILLLIAVSLLFASCRAKTFRLEFELPKNVSATYTISYYAADARSGRYVETAVSLTGGKASQEFPMINPSLIFITSGTARVPVYAERGDKIKITGTDASPYSWIIEGNDINCRWSEWRRANSKALASGDTKAVNKAVADFVSKNTDDPLSTLMLLIDFNRRDDETLFRSLWKKLGDKALEQKWMEVASRNDMLGGEPFFAPSAPPKMIPLKSAARGADTIRPGKTPVFLYFWRTGDEGRAEMVDSMKAMRRRNPDSLKYVIADVCLDADSLGWRSAIANDSLRHTIRAWNPRGEADSLIRALGVVSTPKVVKFNIK